MSGFIGQGEGSGPIGGYPEGDGQEGTLHFDVCGPLPGPGVTLLEASAGTGKTFTIAALVARLVAEGVAALSDILVVTFTRMATGELRDRVRERLVTAEAGLGRFVAGEELPPDDTVLQLLAEGGPARAEEHRERLADALANFDAATITTTHGFCHMVLAALGAWGDVAAGATLLEDPTDLVSEVVDDLLARHVLRSGLVPFRRKVAVQAGLTAVNNPGTPLAPPADARDTSPAGLRRRLAKGARQEVGRRLLDSNLLTYDDLLVRLADALSDEARGATACQRLRGRYRVVLVDEFQDTDTVQWEVVHRAFADGATRLVLIGDPKQAVYSFRGADVYAYLEAARTAGPGRRFTLAQNWRSDADLLAAYDAVFHPLHLGHPEIVYRPARAAPAHQFPGLDGAPCPRPLRVRIVRRQDRLVTRTRTGLLQKDAAVRFVAEDVAADIAGLLASGAKLARPEEAGPTTRQPRAIAAGDIGVLVRTNRQALVVQSALRAVDVPVVVAGAQSVLSTPAARYWLSLLEALEHPASRPLAAAAALTPFFGLSASVLAGADERSWEELHARLHEWSGLVRGSGVAALFWHVSVTERLPARMLRVSEGERQLTDLGHIAELLHAEATQAQLGLPALSGWLSRRIDEAGTEGPDAERQSRRLDSDAAAVQVLTVHRAKGLEFPVVYCPYLWDAGWRDHMGEPVVFHDEAGHRKLDVGGEKGDRSYIEHYQAAQAERRGEDLRHLYVALTRAKHQAVIWWAAAQDCQRSGLGRLLLSRGAAGDVSPSGRPGEPKDEEVEAELQRLSQRVPGLVSIEHCAPSRRSVLPVAAVAGGPAQLNLAPFSRVLDLGWRRSSYTSITAGLHASPGDGALPAGPLVGSEPESPGITDEPGAPAVVPAPAHRLPEESQSTLPSLMGGLPAGAEFGTLVHRVLERVDFSAPEVGAVALEAILDQQARYGGPLLDEGALAAGLEAAIMTPLGPLAPGARLHDFPRSERLDELAFELPLAGGDGPTGEVLMGDIARLLDRHVGAGHPLSGYASSLMEPQLLTNLRGYLTGSLDVVLRWPAGRTWQYFVADYKTNWLGEWDEPLTTWHYRPAALAVEMRRAHYPLQALLYLVALHRYLRWRLPGYDPGAHLGGVLYLFVRGMVGPATPQVGGQTCGVFSWRPPAALVTELSDLLAGPARLELAHAR